MIQQVAVTTWKMERQLRCLAFGVCQRWIPRFARHPFVAPRCELPAPASRRHLGGYKQLLLIGILETPVDVCSQQVITVQD